MQESQTSNSMDGSKSDQFRAEARMLRDIKRRVLSRKKKAAEFRWLNTEVVLASVADRLENLANRYDQRALDSER